MPALVKYPPKKPPGRLPPLVDVTLTDSWRVHDEPDPLKPRKWPAGKWRFDAPDGSWDVTYANLTRIGAFAEVYASRREIGPTEAGRRLSRMSSTGALSLVRLDDPGVLSAFDLDTNISTVRIYTRTMRWGERLREWYPDAEGIAYLGRKAGSHTNFCLWLDRCAARLTFETVGQLADLEPEVTSACDYLHLAPRLFDPAATTGWPGR